MPRSGAQSDIFYNDLELTVSLSYVSSIFASLKWVGNHQQLQALFLLSLGLVKNIECLFSNSLRKSLRLIGFEWTELGHMSIPERVLW